jgi:hypothetical protein
MVKSIDTCLCGIAGVDCEYHTPAKRWSAKDHKIAWNAMVKRYGTVDGTHDSSNLRIKIMEQDK